MAAGDIVSVTVGADGWFADIVVAGLATGGTYAFGLGTNNALIRKGAAPKIDFTVVSKGFDDAGSDTTITRHVYGVGVAPLRTPAGTVTIAVTSWVGTFVAGETITQAVSGATAVVVIDGQAAGAVLVAKLVTGTPNNVNIWTGGTSGATAVATATPVDYATGPHVFNDGTNFKIRVILSDYIYIKDNTGAGNSGTAPTVTIAAGWYTQGGTPNTVYTNGAVTNSSTAAYQPPIMNWSWPGFNRITGNFDLRVVAFHRHPMNGRPVRAVKFSVTDGPHTVVAFAYEPRVRNPDATFPDQTPVVEYIATIDVTTLDQAAELTCNVIAYPWVGDNQLDSSAGTVQPTPLLGPITQLCDKTDAYPYGYAVADIAGGSDPAGVTLGDDASKWVGEYGAASDPEQGGTGAGVTAYQTIARAARAIRNLNNSNGRDDAAGVVYLKAGSYAWLGATISGGYGSVPKTWVIVRPYPAVARADVIINALSGNVDISDRIKLENVTVTSTTNSTFSAILALWFRGVDINTSGSGILTTTNGTFYVTGCKLTQLAQGLRPTSSGNNNCTPSLVRGCDYAGMVTTTLIYTVIGNKLSVKTTFTSNVFQDRLSVAAQPIGTPILAFNNMRGWKATGSVVMLSCGGQDASFLNYAVVQNIFESTTDATAGLGDLWTSEGVTGNTPIDNILLWHNTFCGQRNQFAYNSSGATLKHRRYWSVRGNSWDILGCKQDTFTTVNGARVGGWPVMMGVGHFGNVSASIADITGSFLHDYFGSPGIQNADAADTQPTYQAYYSRLSFAAAGETAGLGDYRIGAASPLLNMSEELCMPFDIAGRRRGVFGAAGAYSGGVGHGGLMC